MDETSCGPTASTKSYEEQGVKNITTVYSVYDSPILPAKSLDAMLIRNAYYEFTAHKSMLRHVRAVFKPGGKLVMEDRPAAE